jgi:hypothetical protein
MPFLAISFQLAIQGKRYGACVPKFQIASGASGLGSEVRVSTSTRWSLETCCLPRGGSHG